MLSLSLLASPLHSSTPSSFVVRPDHFPPPSGQFPVGTEHNGRRKRIGWTAEGEREGGREGGEEPAPSFSHTWPNPWLPATSACLVISRLGLAFPLVGDGGIFGRDLERFSPGFVKNMSLNCARPPTQSRLSQLMHQESQNLYVLALLGGPVRDEATFSLKVKLTFSPD